MKAQPNLWWRPGDGTETAVRVADPWRALEQLDVRFPRIVDHVVAYECWERDIRWDAMQARKRAETAAAAAVKPRGRKTV